MIERLQASKRATCWDISKSGVAAKMAGELPWPEVDCSVKGIAEQLLKGIRDAHVCAVGSCCLGAQRGAGVWAVAAWALSAASVGLGRLG